MAKPRNNHEGGEEIIFRFAVEYKRYDSIGNYIDQGNVPFETKKKAEKFMQDLKVKYPRDNIIGVIRELENHEIIRRYKKESDKKNYRRK